jgi:galactokinase
MHSIIIKPVQCGKNHYFSDMEKNIREQFLKQFNRTPVIFAAPGRVNLIGEHTDYNEGFVLPGAIDKKIYVAIAKNEDKLLNVYAGQYRQFLSFSLEDIKPVKGWATYLLGTIFNLQQKGFSITGIDLIIDGNIPLGAGMSSSAAVCSAFGFALNEIFDLGLSRMDLALLGQKTEHNFAGLQCGIMDQFASLYGKTDHVIKLDCRSLDYEFIPFHFPDHKVVLVNTMITHALASSAYNVRRMECEEGVKVLRQFYPAVHSLRDVSKEQLELHKNVLSEQSFKRCSFIVSENERLLAGCNFLKEGNIKLFGELMFVAHEGLSKFYEVSCAESDFLVELAKSFGGVIGARQMGGGFGGCTINLVDKEAVEDFQKFVNRSYLMQFNMTPDFYITQIGDGAGKIDQ